MQADPEYRREVEMAENQQEYIPALVQTFIILKYTFNSHVREQRK